MERDKFLCVLMLLEGRMGFETGMCYLCLNPGVSLSVFPMKPS